MHLLHKVNFAGIATRLLADFTLKGTVADGMLVCRNCCS